MDRDAGLGVKEESLFPTEIWQHGNSRRSSLLTGARKVTLHRERQLGRIEKSRNKEKNYG
jgi:hypothetical protein